MKCRHCQAATSTPYQKRTRLGYRIFRCHDCQRNFNERTGTHFNELQYPTDVVMLVVLWRIRYKLSLRDLAEMFLVRGYEFSHETVRIWEARFAPLLTAHLRSKRRGQAGKSWYVDETYVKGKGKCQYLYRAIDRDGNLVDTLLSPIRDRVAAKAFFKQAVTNVGHQPERVTTDRHASYPRAIRHTLSRKVRHRTNQYLNNRIEHDHRGLKQRYYPMRGFSSFAAAARFCTDFDGLPHFFRVRSTTANSRFSLSEQRLTFQHRWNELSAIWQMQ